MTTTATTPAELLCGLCAADLALHPFHDCPGARCPAPAPGCSPTDLASAGRPARTRKGPATLAIRVYVPAGKRSKTVNVPCSHRAGGLAVTPQLGAELQPIPRSFVVTHAATGARLPSEFRTRKAAAEYLQALLALPVDWTAKNPAPDRIGQAIQRAIRAAAALARARSSQAQCDRAAVTELQHAWELARLAAAAHGPVI